MAGLLAWAADVVGGGGGQNDEDERNAIPIVFTPEQQKYAIELDAKASSLNRSIQDLRLRLPPPDISQRLPHLHAHSLASNAALVLQLNSHSATREQAHLREVTLQEENAAYEKAISNCETKIQEKMQETDVLRRKLKEMDEIQENLRAELENLQSALKAGQSGKSDDLAVGTKITDEDGPDTEASNSALVEKLENKKKELSLLEENVQNLEKKWARVQENALRQPSPVQREKILDKQLHDLIEQLAGKQAQAEGLVSEIHLKENELERLNGLWRRLDTSTVEGNVSRNRSGRSIYEKGYSSSDFTADAHNRSHNIGGRTEALQRLMLLRSAFVCYILVLHIVVFIKISF